MTKNKRWVSREAYDDEQLVRIISAQMEDKGINVMAWSCRIWEEQHQPIPTWQIEKLCYENGVCTVFPDRDTGEYYALPVAVENIEYSAYGLPSRWRTVAMGIQGGRLNNITLGPDNAVLIWNDSMMTPTRNFVDYCVRQMVKTERNLDNNLMCVRNEIVWTVDDFTVLSSKVLAQKREEGALNVMRIPATGEVTAEVQNLDVQFRGAEYADLYNRYMNMAYAHMGIDSVQIDKKERALTDEVNANNDSTAMIRDSRLAQRRRAVRQMKALWNLDVTVGVNPDLLKQDALTASDRPDDNKKEVRK